MPVAIFATGAFVISKGLLFAWAVAQVDWDDRHLVRAAQVGVVLILFTLLASGGQPRHPGPVGGGAASDANAVEARSFLPSLIGPFTHPLDLGQFSAVVRRGGDSRDRAPDAARAMGATARGAGDGPADGGRHRRGRGRFWLQANRSAAVLVALVACLPVAVLVLAAP